MQRKYAHAIFDFDGVLCDSLAAAINAFNAIRDSDFPSLPYVATREDMTVVYAGSLKTCLHPWLAPEDASRFFDLHSARMAGVAATLQVFPGVGTLLGSLGHGSCSIVTSAYSDAVRAILERDPAYRPSSVFRIAGRELRQSKTQKIRDILAALGLASEDAVYVGDLESDILYCRDVPIDIIAVGYGYQPPTYLQSKHPTYFAESVADLEMLLGSMIAVPERVS